jgi:hypothetical protein
MVAATAPANLCEQERGNIRKPEACERIGSSSGHVTSPGNSPYTLRRVSVFLTYSVASRKSSV